jgi:hypothetical protein
MYLYTYTRQRRKKQGQRFMRDRVRSELIIKTKQDTSNTGQRRRMTHRLGKQELSGICEVQVVWEIIDPGDATSLQKV